MAKYQYTYLEQLKGQDVRVGDMVADRGGSGRGAVFARVTGFTKTQIRCTQLDPRDLSKDRLDKRGNAIQFRLQKDKVGRWGTVHSGGRSIPDTGIGMFRLIDPDEARIVADEWIALLNERRREYLELEAKRMEEAAQRKKVWSGFYSGRTLLNEELGLWQMNAKDVRGDPLVVIWSESPARRGGPDRFYRLTFYYKDRYDNQATSHQTTFYSGDFLDGLSEYRAIDIN